MYRQWIAILIGLIVFIPLNAKGPTIPQLAVSGHAVLKRPADEAFLRLGISTEATTAAGALQLNSDQMVNMINALKEAGLKTSEFQTGQFSLYPLFTNRPLKAPDDWTPEIRGYRVENKLLINTQQIDHLGGWIDIAVQKGANAIDDISFGLHDARNYRDEAIREAAAYAWNDAVTLAASMGVRLGKVLSVNLDQSSLQPMPRQPEPMMFSRAAANVSPPIARGDVDVQAHVTVIYEIIQ